MSNCSCYHSSIADSQTNTGKRAPRAVADLLEKVTTDHLSKLQQQEKAFEMELAKLNDAQLSAVTTIEGPVMVVAGPGTGKTQVVSMRVAQILKKTHMRPSNILCLTFSVSGATAMRERLRSLIAADAYGVTVQTIHGFCQDLISSYPNVFEEWAAMDQITDVERFREVNKIIDQLLPHLSLVHPQRPHIRTSEILGRISQVKREGKTTVDLRRVAEIFDIEMTEKSKEGTKASEKNAQSAQKYREFIEIFTRYQEMLSQTQRYDYDDMILHVIAALQKHEWLLQSLQERYQYVHVDEFQDTNGAQYRLIEVLTTSSILQSDPNLFVVGDDDQAIYRFQGANLTNILSFHKRFPHAPIITLTINYRSTQDILDSAGKLIANNTERLVGTIPGLSKDLVSASGEKGIPPRLLRAPSDMTEPWLVADLIEEQLEKGTALKEIAILTQTNAELRAYYDVLTARKIPVQMTGKIDLLSHPLVRQAIAILRAIHRPEDSSALASALATDAFSCHQADLGRLFEYRKEQKVSLLSALLALEDLREKGMRFANADALIYARDKMLEYSETSSLRSVLEIVGTVLRECGFTKAQAKGETPDPLDIAAIQEFYDRVRSRAFEDPGYSFDSWLDDLAFYENPDYSSLRLSYDLPHLVHEGVQLMTAHQSKGKEFDCVILVNFRDRHWDKRRNPSSLSLPEELLFGWTKDQKTFEQHQDERRVAYVAMTRARKELIFSCPVELTSGDKARSVSPSAFFAEAGNLPEEERGLKDPEKASTLLLGTTRLIDSEFAAFLKQQLEHFSLSVTALNHFLEDPQLFLERDLLRIPQPLDWGFAYGRGVHSALRTWGTGVMMHKPVNEAQFVDAFCTHLKEKEILSEVEYGRLMKLGEDALPRYYAQKLAGTKPVIHRIEMPISAHLEDIPLKGMIDRIDLEAPDSSRATIIDYKTGRPQTEKDIQEGNLMRQLLFYAILLEKGHSILEPQDFVLEFIGERAEHPVTRSFKITADEKESMKKLIREVWKKILALDFSPL